jgi:positive phototaxis protein PixI
MSELAIELLETKVKEVVGLPYLCLELEPKITVAVQLRFIQETLVTLADRFTQMPNVSAHFMGLIEHRNSIFWVLDLPQLLGFAALDSSLVEYPMAVMQVQGALLGMAVQKIGRIVRFSEDDLRSPQESDLPSAVIPFLKGWVPQLEGELYVLDAEAIVLNKFA